MTSKEDEVLKYGEYGVSLAQYIRKNTSDLKKDNKEQQKFAHDFLLECHDLLFQRGKDYDTDSKELSGGERSMGKTVQMFNICTGHTLTESEGWLLQQLLKDVRQWTKPEYHEDSALDCISYSALKAEALSKGK